MKKSLAILTALLACFVGLTGFISGFASSDIIQHTIEVNCSIESAFLESVSFVENFKNSNSRLPSETEFSTWTSSLPNRHVVIMENMRIKTSHFLKESISQFGTPTENEYLLYYWNGEDEEYYASWAHRSTLLLKESDFYIFGSPNTHGTLFLAISALLFYGAYKVWRWPSNQFEDDKWR